MNERLPQPGPQLWSSDERFRAIVEAAPDAVVTTGLDGRVIEWNSQAERMFGWSREEAVGRTVAELMIPDRFHGQHQAGMERFRQTGRGPVLEQRVELTARHRDGREFPVELTTTAVHVGDVIVFNGFVRDLSTQKVTESRGRRQARETRLLQQASILAATSNSFEDALQTCLNNLGEITGWTIGHVLVVDRTGERLVSANLWYHRLADRCSEFLRNTRAMAFRKGEGLPGRVWKSGEAAWITDVALDEGFLRRDTGVSPIRSAFAFPVRAAGEIVAVVEYFHTDRTEPDPQLLELALEVGNQLGRVIERMRSQEERSRLAAIVESSFDAIIGKAPDGTITSWNVGAERMYGFTAAEAIGRPITLILPPGVEQEEPEILEAIASRRRLEQFETRRRRMDGALIDVSLAVSPVHDRDGRFLGVATIERDITLRRRREEELLEARDAAEAANRARGEFLANVSHELRTPMNAILGMTHLALQHDLDSLTRGYLETVKEAADSLLLLLNDILDFSRLEAGRFELDPLPFSLRDLLDESIKLLSLRAHERGLELACRIAPEVPRRVLGDPLRLRQVLMNLVGNAIKFTEQGEVLVEVDAAPERRCTQPTESETGSAKTPGGPQDHETVCLEFRVTDTGIGIAQEHLDRIFAPFTQVDASTTRRYSGTGLGLAICQELTELMGGQVWVDSEPGRGSCFHFTAKLQTVADEPAPDEPGLVTAEQLRGLPVLVVDDNQTNCRVLGEMLTSWNMQPTLVRSAEAALSELRRPSPDRYPLVIVDALMPGMDGFMLLEQAEVEGSLESATILMLSSADRQVFQTRCQQLDIAAYLEKPVSQSELLDAIVTALQGPRADEFVASVTPRASGGLRILVAEDVPANQRVIEAILERRGHQCVLASNGREALERFLQEPFDVILMDVQMPAMDGLQATQAIREQERRAAVAQPVPIVAMTAHAMRGDREKCLAAGMSEYIAKPLEVARLVELVEQLGRRRSVTPLWPPVAAETTPPAAPALDLTAALARLGGDKSLLRSMVEFFLEDAPQLARDLEQHIEQRRPQEAERTAHSLRGLCSNFDASSAAQSAGELERAAAAGDWELAIATLPTFRSHLSRLLEALRVGG